MRIAYRLDAGIARDIRAVKPGYVLKPGELETIAADALPSVQALSDPAAWAARIAAQQAEADRRAIDDQERDQAKQDNAVTQLLDRTPQQISNFIDNQVGNAPELAGVKTVLKLFARVLVIVARRSFR